MSYRLYLDIGNSALKFGARGGGDWLATGSLSYLPDSDTDNMVQDGASLVGELTAELEGAELTAAGCEGLVYSCCNPHVAGLMAALKATFPVALRALGQDVPSPLEIGYANPAELGTDRLANAIGGAMLYGKPCVILDAGTCLTCEVVSADGVILGGAIAAGRAAIMAGIMVTVPHLESALLLTEVPPIEHFVGRSSSEGLVIGITVQLAATADQLARLSLDYVGEEDAPVVVTGGDADLLQTLMEVPTIRNDFLTLEGLRLSDRYD